MTETTQETIKNARSLLKNGIKDEPSPIVVRDLVEAVVELEEELSALKEKYRWRKQSEEPAPEDGLIAIYGASTNWFGMVNSDGFVGQNEYWHPLDLPEEAAK